MKNSEDPQLVANDSIDVVPLLSEIGVEGGSDPVRDRAAAKTFLKHLVADGNTDAFLTKLFPAGIPKDGLFFERIHQIRDVIGIGEFARRAVARLWSHALTQLGRDDQKKLLMAFTCKGSFGFFEDVESLPEVIENHVYEAAFMADWLEALLAVVENDMMQSGVWNSIDSVCQHHQSVAIEIVWLLHSPPKALRTSIAYFMLGVLRALDLPSDDVQAAFDKLDAFFKQHTEHAFRKIHNWSWATTAKKNGISDEELRKLIDHAETSDEDRYNVFCVVAQIRNRCDLPSNQANRCVEWLDTNISSSLSSEAKFFAARLAEKFIDENKEKIELPTDWLVRIQPVPFEDGGTWRCISAYLTDLLEFDTSAFSDLFLKLVEISATTIFQFFSETRNFEHLLMKLSNSATSLENVVGQLLVSLNKDTRLLGLFLFDKLGIQSVPKEILASGKEWTRSLILCESQCNLLGAETTARILYSILPEDKSEDSEYHKHWIDELKLQCRNFSGGFRKELTRIGEDNELIKKALGEVDEYFKDLKTAKESGVNAMQVPGFNRAAMESRKRFSRQARKVAAEHSIFMKMCNTITQIYGLSHSQFINGKLTGARPLASHSSSIEIPVVDFCDPEEMAYRRIVAASKIRDIVDRLEKEAGDEQ